MPSPLRAPAHEEALAADDDLALTPTLTDALVEPARFASEAQLLPLASVCYRMDRRRYLESSGAVGVALLAGCTGGGTGGGGDGTTTTTASDGNGGSGSTTISMVDTAFDPPKASVSPGTTVTWKNEDGFGHDVTATTLTDAGTDWSYESGTVEGGGTATHTFDSTGVYEYYCTIHGESTMCGVVLVGDQQYDETLPCESGGDSGSGGGY